MVYKVVWTVNALNSYLANMAYLQQVWTEKEVQYFAIAVEKKIDILSRQPHIGAPRNKRNQDLRHTVIHKRISLIYRVRLKKETIELILFWNTYQHPAKLRRK